MADGLEGAVLRRTSETEYCLGALQMRHNQFWWYYNGLVPSFAPWRPFQDRTGRWWYHVKPGFAWPVDYFRIVAEPDHGLERRWLLGWQYPVPPESSDSRVWLNVIHDLKGYGISRVASNKRRAVRKGFRNLRIEVVDPSDPSLGREACEVWNSHVERTGWNTRLDSDFFVQTWRELARWPGTTVMTARDPNAGDQLCAWLIARVIDETVYVDTIASHTDRLAHRPNDAIIFQCLVLAEGMGVRHAHYSLKSKLESLETFKQSLGFTAHPFPSRLNLRRPIGPVLARIRPEIYMRLLGDPVWTETEARRRLRPSGRRTEPEHGFISPREWLELRATQRPGIASAQSREIAPTWYVPAEVPAQRGWLVYSLDLVLAALQGSITEPENVRRTAFWKTIGALVRGAMGVAQAVLYLLAKLPIISWVYETVARTFTRNAVGFFLRSCYWKARLQHLGTDTLIDQGVEIWGAANVSIGSNCHIDTNVRLAAGERRHRQRGSITLGNYVHLGPGVHIAGRGGVTIHDCVGISALTHLYSATNAIELPSDPGQLISMSHMAPPNQQYIVEGPIEVEPYAFIGMMARVMPNVRIGYGAVVHAAAEVTRDVAPFANYGGPPRGRQIGWRKPRRRSPHLKESPGASCGERKQ